MPETSVALGMSGGVDSCVAALLLLEQGFDVVGVTCVFVDDEATAGSLRDAQAACNRLHIPHKVLDCTKRFHDDIIEAFIRAYRDGLTPSPCVDCNALVKLPALVQAADAAGCTYIATGHYARMLPLPLTGRATIATAKNPRKDQSYMLSRIPADVTNRLLLPLGAYDKPEVRLLAEQLSADVASKPDSQDICFAPTGHLDLLERAKALGEPGAIVDTAGKHLGAHRGLARYTIGQRKGIGIAASEPYYVIGKDAARNELVVGFAHEAAITHVSCTNAIWLAGFEPGKHLAQLESMAPIYVKLRYRSAPSPCTIRVTGNAGIDVALDEPAPPTAAGQYAVFYHGCYVIGGAMIAETKR